MKDAILNALSNLTRKLIGLSILKGVYIPCMGKRCLWSMICLMLVSASIWATDSTLKFSARVDGKTLNGEHVVVIKLFSDKELTTQLHSETQTLSFLNSLFSVELGREADNLLPISVLASNTVFYVDMVLTDPDPEERLPLLEVHAAPYAFKAHYLDWDNVPDDSIEASKIKDLPEQVQSDWSQASDTHAAYIKNKPSFSTSTAVDDVTIEYAGAGDDVLQVKDDGISNAKMADNAVNTAELVDNAVTNAKMADNAVNTAELVDNAVTNAKMADDAVNTAELVDNAVTNAKMADNAIGNNEMADNAVTNAEVSAGNFPNIQNIGCPSGYEVVGGGRACVQSSEKTADTFAVAISTCQGQGDRVATLSDILLWCSLKGDSATPFSNAEGWLGDLTTLGYAFHFYNTNGGTNTCDINSVPVGQVAAAGSKKYRCAR